MTTDAARLLEASLIGVKSNSGSQPRADSPPRANFKPCYRNVRSQKHRRDSCCAHRMGLWQTAVDIHQTSHGFSPAAPGFSFCCCAAVEMINRWADPLKWKKSRARALMTALFCFVFFNKSFASISLVCKLLFINGCIGVISRERYFFYSYGFAFARHFMCASHTCSWLKMRWILYKAFAFFLLSRKTNICPDQIFY